MGAGADDFSVSSVESPPMRLRRDATGLSSALDSGMSMREQQVEGVVSQKGGVGGGWERGWGKDRRGKHEDEEEGGQCVRAWGAMWREGDQCVELV